MAVADELLVLRSELQSALDRVDQLILKAKPKPGDSFADMRELPRTKAIESVLDRANGPMRPIEIWKLLLEAGRTDPKMEVQVTTFSLWERSRIGKVGRGLYIAKRLEEAK